MPDPSYLCILLQPYGRTVRERPGTLLVEAIAHAGLSLRTPCGQGGTCGKCRVRFQTGAPTASAADREVFDGAQCRDGWRLACQVKLSADAVVHIPASSLLAGGLQMQSRGLAEGFVVDDPPATPQAGRRNLAAAFDIGTTTLAGCLLDLDAGRELALASEVNPQVRFGDDVIARVGLATQGRAHELRDAVLEGVGLLLDCLCEQGDCSRTSIGSVAFAGNTVMQHLLVGCDVAGLAALPFEPATTQAMTRPAADFDLGISSEAEAYVFPAIGGFVGGDVVAGLLATALAETDGPALLVDVGTNGEVVVFDGEKLLAASAAAGPAFEGARLSGGMRATPGAIERVCLDGRLELGVIGGVEPAGLCGSAAIDLLAELLEIGALESTGRLLAGENAPADIAGNVRRCLRDGPDGPEVLLSEGSQRVALTQKDIRELQLAVGAIRATVAMLLDRAGLAPGDLHRIVIAGGFGSFIRRDHAQRIGLVPQGIAHERIHGVGNVALTGATAAAVSLGARRRAEALAERCRHVELSADPAFQMTFAESMLFPPAT